MDCPDLAIQHLLSLPAGMVERFAALEAPAGDWFVGADPAGRPLGSGGGTAHLLECAWRALGKGQDFESWLEDGGRLVLHAGGQSRRLPAYAAVGKALMPFPVFRWGRGQRLSQTLLEVQLPDYHRILRQGAGRFPVLLASGDVLLRFGPDLPAFPDVDVLGLGMWTTPSQAQDFGVFFVPRTDPGKLAFFLQKPRAARISALAEDHLFLVDTGMWLLSPRAVGVLMARCGWSPEAQRFDRDAAEAFDFYGEFATALGSAPSRPDPGLVGLTAAVVALPQPEFHHFGTSRQMIESVARLQHRELDQTLLGGVRSSWGRDQFLLNARVEAQVDAELNPTLWIENSVVPRTWQLSGAHVLTGIPENHWSLRLEPGVCLDFVPVAGGRWCVRFYGLDDRFAGRLGEEEVSWLGRPAGEWFRARGLEVILTEEGDSDIQRARLFPVLDLGQIDGPFLEWLTAAQPVPDDVLAARWTEARRLSAAGIQTEADLGALYAQRVGLRRNALGSMLRHRHRSVFSRLDLRSAAAEFAGLGEPVPGDDPSAPPLDRVHLRMFGAAVLRHRGEEAWVGEESRAFSILRETLVREAQVVPALPRLTLMPDQLVWARSPVRFDLAGGWTDTPPYCLEHGGQVVNVAVDLNGQPPMQVFVRRSPRFEILLRSIDLGLESRVRTFEELDTFAEPGSAFALAKAALGLAGFLPRFHAEGGRPNLTRLLEGFGGGLELSLVSAVPKGSGLGTSSILAATVLAALSEVCGLGWDQATLFSRTLALEQMITTGGGWQDQAGGVLPGIKLIETSPGLRQEPRIRWLPERLLSGVEAGRRVLLYYTGITRMAKGILGEIVRGIFLNSPEHLAVLAEIGRGAQQMVLAFERCDYDALTRAVRHTWRMKCRLDEGTSPPAVRHILESVREDLDAATLPGAGGGGYLLMFARDEAAAARIRRRLTANPVAAGARFVDFRVSSEGLQVTRS